MPSSYSQSNEGLIRSIGMIGKSDVMADLARTVLNFRANNEQRLLIVGEPDTGKSILAEALTEAGNSDPGERKRYSVDASYYANDIIGFVQGLFGDDRENYPLPSLSGAQVDPMSLRQTVIRVRYIERLCLPGQNVLEYGLQQDRFRRIRLIATARTAIFDQIKTGTFLNDLYNSFDRVIVIPPLRERLEDIDCFVPFFLAREYMNYGIKMDRKWDQSATEELKRYDWQGNGRQLSGIIFQALNSTKKGGVVDRNAMRAVFSERKITNADSFYVRGNLRPKYRGHPSMLASIFSRLL